MKPETATAITVSVLLGCSALFVGVRHAIDTRKAEAQAPASPAKVSVPLPEPTRPAATATAERASAAASDPESMAKRLRSLHATTNEADRIRALLKLVASFKGSDWQLALEELAKMEPREEGPSSSLILSAWAESDPQAAMIWSKEKAWAEAVVIRALIATDLDSAIGFLKAMDDKYSCAWESLAIRAWVAKDPGAAIEFIKAKVGKDPERGLLLLGEAVGELDDDLPRIAQIFPLIPEEKRKGLRVRNAEIGKLPVEKLKDWIESMEPSLKDPAVRMLFGGAKDFESTLALARAFPEQIGPGEYFAVYRAWFAADEVAATKEIEATEPGPMREAALGAVVFGLYAKNRLPEALELTKRWPEATTQQVLGEITLLNEAKDAEAVLKEIPRLKNDSLRLNRYSMALQMWFQEDAKAARKWLKENQVPEQVKKEFEGK